VVDDPDPDVDDVDDVADVIDVIVRVAGTGKIGDGKGMDHPHRKPWSGSAPASAAGKPCRAMPANAGGDGRRFPDRECQIDHIKRCPWQSCRPPHYVAH